MTFEEGKVIEVTAYEVDRFGKGVSKVDDFVIFTDGLLEGETAKVEISKVKKNFAEAKIKKLINQSPLRKTFTSKLGALDLYHLKDEEQIKWQETITKNILSRSLGVNIELSNPIFGSSLNYRNKVVYHVLEDEILKLGMYQKDPIELIEVHTFILNHPLIQRVVSKIQQQRILVDYEALKHIVFRTNGQKVLVTLVSYKEQFKGLNELVQLIKTFDEVIGITLNIKPSDKVILGPHSKVLFGENQLTYQFNHLTLKINDRSFMQVHTEVMLNVYEKISKYITQNDVVIDAYSGVGSIGYSIGESAKKVIMIENNPENTKMARELKKHHKGSYEVIEGNVEKELRKVRGDIIILDPPRSGLDPKALPIIFEKKFKRIIYLSCELNTLQRDLKVLCNNYDINAIHAVRMFPQTTSIETLVILDKKH